MGTTRTQSSKKATKEVNTLYRDDLGGRKPVYKRFKEGIDYLPLEKNEALAMLHMAKNACKRIGRPPIFETVEELQEAIDAYWDYLIKANEADNVLIPDIEGVCLYLGISRMQLFDWERNNYRGFSDTIKELKNQIAACKKQMALHGKIPPLVFATDFNNNHGYVQKQSLELMQKSNPLGEDPDAKALQERADNIVIDAEDVEVE